MSSVRACTGRARPGSTRWSRTSSNIIATAAGWAISPLGKTAAARPWGWPSGGREVVLARRQVTRGRSLLRPALAAGRARAVYVHRDVREVAFSLMHKRGKTFEQLVRQGMIHQILANDRFWMAQPNILVQRYDDILADPVASVQSLAGHLGIALDQGQADRIADLYSQESNRARAEALRRGWSVPGSTSKARKMRRSATRPRSCTGTTCGRQGQVRGGPVRPPVSARPWSGSARAGSGRAAMRLDPKPARVVSLAPRQLRECAAREADIAVGLFNFLLRSGTQRFPGAARAVKRLLGMPIDTKAGATAWSDPVSLHGRSGRTDVLTGGAASDGASAERSAVGSENFPPI